MVYSKTILLRATQNPSRRIKLTYRSDAKAHSQARLKGRRSLSPVIALEDYSCRAVIDWVRVTFYLARPTQFRYVQSELETATDTRLFVDPQMPDAGRVSSVFTIFFYDTHLASLRKCREVVKAKFGESAEPFVDLLEVSVDFRPREPSDDSRALMVAVLTRHLYPDRDVLKRASTRPRFSWGRGRLGLILRRSQLSGDDGDLFLNPAGDVSPPIDATYYLGHKAVGPLWRIMDKVVDRQNRQAGTWIDIPDEEKRARVEVRLDRLELMRLGVTGMDALMRINFAQLQGTYFKFMLPTFIESRMMNAADRYWEGARMERFLNNGVLGLRAMDERRHLLRMRHTHALAGSLHSKGAKTPVAKRSGRGVSGTLVAYALLSDRVSMALRKLMERERRMLGYSY